MGFGWFVCFKNESRRPPGMTRKAGATDCKPLQLISKHVKKVSEEQSTWLDQKRIQLPPRDKRTGWAGKGSAAFDYLTQHSAFTAEEAFQLTSENTKLSDSQEIPLALRIKQRGMESILYCLNNAFITLDTILKQFEL